MTQDRSLEEFQSNDTIDRALPDPSIEVTYQSDPAGRPCTTCGNYEEQLWWSDDGLVCQDCKQW